MRTTTARILALLGLVAFVSFVSLSSVAAQAQPPQAGASQAQPPQAPGAAPAQKAETAKGELKSVDATAKTLTISAGGKDQRFTYTDSTKVSGAQGGVAGLATMSGREVTVQFTMQGANSVATSIEVAPQK